jgi:spermidine synthase
VSSSRALLPLALAVFTASGFAGLMYESVWTHYLKLFLGHSAYAQPLVLGIFMGGMALGAWIASRLSQRLRDLLLAYALIEVAVGIAAIVFHPVFVAATGAAFDRVIPALGSPAAGHAFKWALGAALVLPQSILLGMTFPLMTGGVLRLGPARPGYVVAMLYFTNSLGAALGVLASGFYFISTVGLPGTLIAAGVVNLGVAAAVMLLPGRKGPIRPDSVAAAPAGQVPALRLLLAVAALTGMSSFMYEIGWIRMLALVLGSSTHAFELMLSAFILGIAFGGLWVRRRIDAAGSTVRLLAWVQLAMGIAALATIPIYGWTFHAMAGALDALARTESGYLVFNVVSHALCLAVMFPAAFCAGMTLPLITVSLLRQGAGERAIGQVYAANTAGAIVGVLIAVHVGFTLLGLEGLIAAGAAIDLALGVVLLRAAAPAGSRRVAFAAAGLGAAAIGAALLFPLNARLMASGVYRVGGLLPQHHVLHRQLHGKTATVSITESRGTFSVRTNGKPDGALRLDRAEPAPDEVTMTMLGALPLLLAPDARRVANIGFGTGMTTHVLLASPQLERVDSIEIEPAMVEAVSAFRRANARAYDDPRSRIHYEDAKTFFSVRRERYDVIVSEPSNPWVSGVASLFSTEFYRDVRRHLNDGGLLVQWVQLYEITPELLATIVAALHANFSDYEFWLPGSADLVIVAAHNGPVPAPSARSLAHPALRAELERFSIASLDDLALHRVAGRATLGPYFASFRVPPNSDYFPALAMRAPLARYMQSAAPDFAMLSHAPLPLLALFDERARRHPEAQRLSPGERPWLPRAASVREAHAAHDYLRSGAAQVLAGVDPQPGASLVLLRAALVECRVRLPEGMLRHQLAALARLVGAQLPSRAAVSMWSALASTPCAAQLSDADRRWLRLHGAVAAGHAPDMAAAALAIFDGESALPPELAAHALAGFMAASLLTRDAEGALAAFNRHREAFAHMAPEWRPVFRFLLAHAERM